MLVDVFFLDRPLWNGDFTTFAVAMPADVGLFALTGQDATLTAVTAVAHLTRIGEYGLEYGMGYRMPTD